MLFQQRVTAGQHHAVERKTRQHLQCHVLLVDAQPDRPARAGRLQLHHRRQGLLQGLAQHVSVVVAVGQRTDVVQQQYVDVVGAQALQAGSERTPHAVGAVIELGAPPGHGKTIAADNGLGVVVDAAADLGRQRVVRARDASQATAQARFAQSIAVVGRSIEMTDASLERACNRGQCVCLIHFRVQVADRRGAEAQRR